MRILKVSRDSLQKRPEHADQVAIQFRVDTCRDLPRQRFARRAQHPQGRQDRGFAPRGLAGNLARSCICEFAARVVFRRLLPLVGVADGLGPIHDPSRRMGSNVAFALTSHSIPDDLGLTQGEPLDLPTIERRARVVRDLDSKRCHGGALRSRLPRRCGLSPIIVVGRLHK